MKKLILLVLAAIVVAAGVTLVKNRKAQLAMVKPPAVLPVVVDTATLIQKPVTLTLPAMGIIKSDLSPTLSTKISSRITAVYKNEGDRVKKGDILATLDASDLIARKQGLLLKKQGLGFEIDGSRHTIKSLEASLASAEEIHKRTGALLKVKGASMEQYRNEEVGITKIKSQLASAHNGISALEKNQQALGQNIKEIENLLTYTTITSPISGTVSRRMAMVGDMTGPGKTLFQISAESGFYINLSLPDSINPHHIIFKDKKLTLVPKNQATATGLVQYLAALPHGEGVVDGQYVNVRVVVYENRTTLIPMDGILNVGSNSFIYILENNQAKKITVHVVARGSEGLVVDRDFSGKTIITAKPDILLRVSAGVPILISDHIGQADEKSRYRNLTRG